MSREYEALLAEIGTLSSSTNRRQSLKRAAGRVSEWDMDLAVFTLAWLSEEHGVDLAHGELMEAQSAAQAVKVLLAGVMKMPEFVDDSPFDEAEDLWKKAVARLVKDGKVFNSRDQPNVGAAVNIWKSYVARIYGFRPTRTEEQKMKDQIKDAVSGAAMFMRAKKAGANVDPDTLKRSAKLLGGRGRQVRKKKAKSGKRAR